MVKRIMITKKEINSDGIEVISDAVIVIIMTVLVIQLPQLEQPSLAAIWKLKFSYLPYIISFIICITLWMNHHTIFQQVRTINNSVIIITAVLLALLIILPYITSLLSENFHSLISQLIYSINFILVYITFLILTRCLVNISGKLNEISYNKKEVMIVLVLFILGISIGLNGYPELISVFCLLSSIVWYFI